MNATVDNAVPVQRRVGASPTPTLLLTVAFFLLSPLLASCADEDAEAQSNARVITTRDDLIGGPSALGEMGDILIENDQIRVIIHDEGFSRGSGIFGGVPLDIDLRRPSEGGDRAEGSGRDAFGEMFPAFFFQAAAVESVEILSDGSDGGPAVVMASGTGADIFNMLGALNRITNSSHNYTGDDEDGDGEPDDRDLTTDIIDALAGIGDDTLQDVMRRFTDPDAEANVRYETVYELHPGERHLVMRFRIVNITDETLEFPASEADLIGIVAPGLDLSTFTIPLADAALFGAASPLWMPGYGFDQHFSLLDAFATQEVAFPAFPGLVADWAATHGDHVSYGLFLEPSEEHNFLFNKRDVYEGQVPNAITDESMLLFIQASGMSAFLEYNAPASLEPGEAFEVTKYLAVGTGDVGSVLDVYYDVRGVATGRLGGQVRDALTNEMATDASVIIYQRDGGERTVFAQYDVQPNGSFGGSLAPGPYSAIVTGDGRVATSHHNFTIREGETTGLQLIANSPGRIVVTTLDDLGRRIPARATAVGTYDDGNLGEDPDAFLYDLGIGESFRYTDMIPDTRGDRTRRYIEAKEPTVNGVAELVVRPGTYEVFTSRGPEYDIQRAHVVVGPGESVSVTSALTRVVDTAGWIAVDPHIHTEFSPDSNAPVERQLRRSAAEGIEVAVATDHNNVTDFRPYVARDDLQDFIFGMAGLELTTLDGGHFNAYPLRYDVGPTTHGSFEWSQRPPGEIFDDLRALGSLGPDQTIVQVNHPRDTVLGYFNQFRVHGLTTEHVAPEGFSALLSEQGPTFYDDEGNTNLSLDFNALEVLNANRIDILHHYRVPEMLPAGEVPADVPPPGTILLDEDAEVAFPGAVDDWYNFLNLGHRFVGIGASDSHDDADPIGYGRTLAFVGDDDPLAITEQALVDALLSRRVIMTNGPVVDFYVNDASSGVMGSTINDNDGAVDLTIDLTAAPWMSVSRINVVRNGLLAHVIEVDADRDLTANPLTETVELDLATDGDGDAIDSWFTVEVIGYRSLFPVVWPYEKPSIVIGDAVGQIAEPLGFADPFGSLRPALSFPVAAYALTNPVWVIAGDGNEWTPPGLPDDVLLEAAHDSGLDQNPRYAATYDHELAGNGRPVGVMETMNERPPLMVERAPSTPYDLRRIFLTFGNH